MTRSTGSEDRVSFRIETDGDLPRFARWLSDPDVARWYDDGETTLEHLGRR